MKAKRVLHGSAAAGTRRMIPLLLALFIAVTTLTAGLTLAAKPALACSCAVADTDRSIAGSDHIFAGTVVERRETPPRLGGGRSSADPVYYVFEVDRAWKGDVYEKTTLYSEAGSESCGMEFKQGEKYLVFAQQGNKMATSGFCSGNETYTGGADPAVVQKLGAPIELRAGASPGTPNENEGMPYGSSWLWGIGGLVAIGLVVLTIVRARRADRRR